MHSEQFLDQVDESWTLFLDRDGVINRRIIDDYVKRYEDFIIINGVLEALNVFNDIFYKIVIVTNQQGIGKELMTHRQLHDIHSKFLNEVANAHARIDEIYYCPDLKYLNSTRRKPAPGMAYDAKRDFPNIDFNKSIMVGDTISDMEFGKNLCMKTILVEENSRNFNTDLLVDIKLHSLLDFALLLKSYL